MGREYAHELGKPTGAEIPASHFELWETPEKIMKHASLTKNPDAAAFRETFVLAHSLFDSIP